MHQPRLRMSHLGCTHHDHQHHLPPPLLLLLLLVVWVGSLLHLLVLRWLPLMLLAQQRLLWALKVLEKMAQQP